MIIEDMDVHDVRWQDKTTIVAVINGETVYVPDDMANPQRQLIERYVQAHGVILDAHTPKG